MSNLRNLSTEVQSALRGTLETLRASGKLVPLPLENDPFSVLFIRFSVIADVVSLANVLRIAGQLPMLAMSLPTFMPQIATAAAQLARECTPSNESGGPTPEQISAFSDAVRSAVSGLVSDQVAETLRNVAAQAVAEEPVRDFLSSLFADLDVSGNDSVDNASVPAPSLRRGDEGGAVMQLHRCLANLGYLDEEYLNGHNFRTFGAHTEEALLAFQADFGLYDVEDGVYDQVTFDSLQRLYDAGVAAA